MGYTEDGSVPDIRIDALGVLGRLNPGQCIEQELNWIGTEVQRRIKEEDDLGKKFKILYKFLDIASPDEANSIRDYLAYQPSNKVKEFMDAIEKDRIYIIQKPMDCVSGDTLCKLYKEFSPKLTNIYYKNEYGERAPTIRPMIVADEYILRLKQEPITKFSVRSKSMINPRTSMPIKSTKAARKKQPYPDQCKSLHL